MPCESSSAPQKSSARRPSQPELTIRSVMSQHVPVVANANGRRIPEHRLEEKQMLWGFLQFARATVIAKIEGLSHEDVRRSHVASGTSIGGLMKHLAGGENHWFGNTLGGLGIPLSFDAGDPDGDWRLKDMEGPERLVANYRSACNSSDKIIASLNLDSTGAQMNDDYTLRWVMNHQIAETNRHLGQADLMRELTDGARGW